MNELVKMFFEGDHSISVMAEDPDGSLHGPETWPMFARKLAYHGDELQSGTKLHLLIDGVCVRQGVVR